MASRLRGVPVLVGNSGWLGFPARAARTRRSEGVEIGEIQGVGLLAGRFRGIVQQQSGRVSVAVIVCGLT